MKRISSVEAVGTILSANTHGNLTRAEIKGNLVLNNKQIASPLVLVNTLVQGFLALSGLEAHYLELQGSSVREASYFTEIRAGARGTFRSSSFFGNVYLTDSVFGGPVEFTDSNLYGFLDLQRLQFTDWLDLSFGHPPNRIYVSENLAEKVHLAAPKVPLVVVPNKTTSHQHWIPS